MNIQAKDLAGAREALGDILKSVRALDGANGRLHKAFEGLDLAQRAHDSCHKDSLRDGKIISGDLHDKCHKLHGQAHESARLARLEHKTDHNRHMSKVASAVGLLTKILGGGPELASPTDGPVKLPNRLPTSNDTEKALGVNKNFRQQSPFDVMTTQVLEKSGTKAITTRRNPNITNPMWNGR
jgi:hypothetical protein